MAKAKSFRKIHMGDGSVWEYRLGRGGIWLRCVGTPKRHYFDFRELTNLSWDHLERAARKWYWPEVRPSYIKSFIRRRVLRGECPCNWARMFGRLLYDYEEPPAEVLAFWKRVATELPEGIEGVPEELRASVLELVDGAGLNPAALRGVQVRSLSGAP